MYFFTTSNHVTLTTVYGYNIILKYQLFEIGIFINKKNWMVILIFNKTDFVDLLLRYITG